MNRIPKIASALALVVALCACAPSGALAGSPLLSGYGGPGAGEQAIIGSTLLNVPGGGAGSNGSPGSAAGTQGGYGTGLALGGGGVSGSGGSQGGRAGSGTLPGGASQSNRANGTQGRSASAYVYPLGLRSASADSPVLGLSNGDLLLLVAMIAALALVGALTVRMARLQR